MLNLNEHGNTEKGGRLNTTLFFVLVLLCRTPFWPHGGASGTIQFLNACVR